MIPVSLSLKNFMSYGEEGGSLDFSGIHVACLSGDNGNGKSALLDAITYALWGKTRASGNQASSEDDLVRLGAEEMEVRFEFRLNEDLYRVFRRRNRRTRTGDWQLHLQAADGTWKPVGGSTMRETERHLVRLLRMEYETFVNSAYIQQGRADEFTRQKPDARKRILADILDLKRYDRLEQMARDRRNECDLAIRDLDGEIRVLAAQASDADSHRLRLAEQEEALATWSSERAVRQERVEAFRTRLAALDERAQRLKERDERLREAEQEILELTAEMERLTVRIRAADSLLSEREQIETDVGRLLEARAALERLEADVAALQSLRTARAETHGRLKLRRQELESEIRAAEREWLAGLERAKQIESLENRLAEIAPRLALLLQAEAEMASVKLAAEAAQQRFADLLARNKQLKTESEELDEVLTLLGHPTASCPVCDSDLSGGRREAVLTRQRARRHELERQLGEMKAEGMVRKHERDTLQQKMGALEEQLRGVAAFRAQQVEWRKNLAELCAQHAGFDTVQKRLGELRSRLDREDYGAEERAAIAAIEAEITRLGTASADYEAVRTLARDLTAQGAEARHAQLAEAERGRAQMESDLKERSDRRARRQVQVQSERERLEALRVEIGDLAAIRLQAQGAEQELDQAVTACESAGAQVARCRQALADCAAAADQAARKGAERDNVAKDKQAYTELAAAFGRKGVQALIIHNALPEIEDEANRLLARMTDNALKVQLDTLREARSGVGPIETLDIKITDDAGPRPYEMYSGGEAFRVDFALRIAISRLLAHRAGASLQTLILDEGFGTQDAKGRERLVEAIESVADEFAQILVVTHVEELKDAFPTRIEVLKTPSGSQINFVD